MKKIKIYFTSDTHGYLLNTNYQTRNVKAMGMYNAMQDFNKDGNTLVLDGGDSIQGSSLVRYALANYPDYSIVAEAFNLAKYDCLTLGNHDFNYGYDVLNTYLSQTNQEILVANIKDKTNNLNIKPYVIKTMENGVKVGIVGLITDYVPVWENPKHIENFEFFDAFNTAKKYLEEIKNLCDVTVCVYHGGFEANLDTNEILSTTNENVGYKICNELNFDLLLTSHQHMPVDFRKVGNSYVFQNAANLTSYAEIEIDLDNKSFKGERVAVKNYTLNNVPAKLLEIENQTQKYLDEKVGSFLEAVPVQDKLTLGVNGSRMADFSNQIQLEFTKADFSCTSLSNDLIGIPNEVSIRDVMTLYPFANTIVVLEVTKEIIFNALERVAEYFEVVNNEIVISDKFLIPKVEHYNVDFFMGFDYTLDISQPIGSRVKEVLLNGKELEDKTYTLAMNNYRATGTGGYPFYRDCKVVKEYSDEVQEIVIDYIKNKKEVAIVAPPKYKVIKTV